MGADMGAIPILFMWAEHNLGLVALDDFMDDLRARRPMGSILFTSAQADPVQPNGASGEEIKTQISTGAFEFMQASGLPLWLPPQGHGYIDNVHAGFTQEA